MNNAESNWTIAAGFAIALALVAGCQDESRVTVPGRPPGTPPGGVRQEPPKSYKGSPLYAIEGSPQYARIRQVYWSGDGKRLVTTADDGSVTIWDPTVERPKPGSPLGLHTFQYPGALMAVPIAVNGDILIEPAAKKLTVRKISTGEALRVLEQSEHVPLGTPFFLSDDAKRLVTLDTIRQEFNVWDVTTGKLIHSKTPKTERVAHQIVCLSKDAEIAYAILTGIQKGNTYSDLPIEGVHALNIKTGEVEIHVKNPIQFSGRMYFPITADRHLFMADRSWDLLTGKELGEYPWPRVDAVAPSGRFVASEETIAGLGWRIAIWDVREKKKIGVLPDLAVLWQGMALSSDGRYLAVGGCRDWDSDRLPPKLRQKRPPDRTEGRPAKALHVEDRVLLLFDVQTQKLVRVLAFPVYPIDSSDVPDPEIP